MTLILEYANDYRTFAAQNAYLNWADIDKQKRIYYRLLLRNGFLLLAGLYCSIKAEIISLVAIFAIYLVAFLFGARPYSIIERRATEAVKSKYAVRAHRLEVTDDGLRESVEGIVSFAPWASVISFGVFRDVLFIQLSAGLWAMVPCYAIREGSATIEQLIAELRARGVPERASVSA